MTLSIELELKIDEVIKRLERTEEYRKAYGKFMEDNKEEVIDPKREFIYVLFDYNRYEYHLCFANKLSLYLPDVIILGAF